MTPNARQLPAHSVDAYGATKFLDDTYVYDATGNVLSMADLAGTGPNDRTWGVAAPTLYDGLDRLLSVRGTNWGTLTGSYNALYTYDPLDNIRSAKVGASGYTHAYDLGAGTGNTNRLLSMQLNGGTTYALTTDPAGNITSDARTNHGYQFDVAHRLSAVTGTGAESYLYDGNGRRARTLNSTTGTIEYFGYGADGRLLQDWSSRRGNRKGYIYLGNSLVATYGVTTVNPNLGAITVEYKHTDALGSPVVATDAARVISGRQIYTPFGVPLAPIDGVGYTGHYIDVGTGLTYMQQRYYDPQVGRFLSVDPAGAGFNLYNYANNNPYKFTDPDGRRDVYIGGADDKDATKIVQGVAERQQALHPQRDIQYFSWRQGSKINAAIQKPLSKNEPLNVIGHSLGASRAIQAANENKVPIANLISIDPVGTAGGNGSKPSNVSTWTNVIGSPSKREMSDTVASLGRTFLGSTLTGGADISQASGANHGDFSKMMGEVGAEKKIDASYQSEPSK